MSSQFALLVICLISLSRHEVACFSWSSLLLGGEEPKFDFPTMRSPDLKAPYKKCSSKDTYGAMVKVDVIPCPSPERCPLVRNTNVTMILDFIPSFPAKVVVGSLAGVFRPFPEIAFGKPEDLCETKQVECPLVPGKTYQYTTTVFVKPSYPRVNLNVKVLVQGDKHDIACALVPVQITDPPTSPTSTTTKKPWAL